MPLSCPTLLLPGGGHNCRRLPLALAPAAAAAAAAATAADGDAAAAAAPPPPLADETESEKEARHLVLAAISQGKRETPTIHLETIIKMKSDLRLSLFPSPRSKKGQKSTE